MPSNSYRHWTQLQAKQLDQVEAAHASVGGTRRGRRYATDQINQAYTVLLASQFQKFCRDLHSESVEFLVETLEPASLRPIVQSALTQNRKLDQGNANPGVLGADFGRLGLLFWNAVKTSNPRGQAWIKSLDHLNDWRNAVAHQNFQDLRTKTGIDRLGLAQVRTWRRVCTACARAFDRIMQEHIHAATGKLPW